MKSDRGESWTEERIELLKKLWAEGLSASEVAKRMGGITRNSVLSKIHRIGMAGRGRAPKPRTAPPRAPSIPANAWPKEKEDLFRELWLSGMAVAEIARQMSFGSEQNIYYHADRLGLPRRERKKALDIQHLRDARNGTPKPHHERAEERLKETSVPQTMTYPLVQGLPRALAERHQNQCNWPVGEVRDPSFHYCTNSRDGEDQYCSEHRKLSIGNQAPGKWDKSREAWARANAHLPVAQRVLKRLAEGGGA